MPLLLEMTNNMGCLKKVYTAVDMNEIVVWRTGTAGALGEGYHAQHNFIFATLVKRGEALSSIVCSGSVARDKVIEHSSHVCNITSPIREYKELIHIESIMGCTHAFQFDAAAHNTRSKTTDGKCFIMPVMEHLTTGSCECSRAHSTCKSNRAFRIFGLGVLLIAHLYNNPLNDFATFNFDPLTVR